MTTFDGWEARLCGDAMALPMGMISDDYLMHFRTKGSKNGVRRYQESDGSWTPLGLRLRKEREGWGETKKERKAQKKVEKAERRANKAAAKIQKKEEYKKKLMERTKYKDKDKLSDLSDEELQKKIERAKLVAEYKELTKSPLLRTGERAFEIAMKHLENKSARELEREKMDLERKRLDVDEQRAKASKVQQKEMTKQARANKGRAKMDARKARMEARRMKQDRKAGLEEERKANRLRAEEAMKLLTWKGSHFRAKNLRVARKDEQKRAINKGTAFIRGIIESKKLAAKNKVKYLPEAFEGQRDYVKSMWNIRLQAYQADQKTKQMPYEAEIARAGAQTADANAEASYWAYLKQLSGGGKKKK